MLLHSVVATLAAGRRCRIGGTGDVEAPVDSIWMVPGVSAPDIAPVRISMSPAGTPWACIVVGVVEGGKELDVVPNVGCPDRDDIGRIAPAQRKAGRYPPINSYVVTVRIDGIPEGAQVMPVIGRGRPDECLVPIVGIVLRWPSIGRIEDAPTVTAGVVSKSHFNPPRSSGIESPHKDRADGRVGVPVPSVEGPARMWEMMP